MPNSVNIKHFAVYFLTAPSAFVTMNTFCRRTLPISAAKNNYIQSKTNETEGTKAKKHHPH